MQLLGLPVLESLKLRQPPSRAATDSWRSEVEDAKWRGPQDVKNRYATASFLSDNRVVFNLKGNLYRIVTKVRYANQIVLVTWAGTHSDYDKLKLV